MARLDMQDYRLLEMRQKCPVLEQEEFDGIAAAGQMRQAEFEPRHEILARGNRWRRFAIARMTFLPEQNLSQPVPQHKSEDRLGERGFGPCRDAQFDILAARGRGQRAAVKIVKLRLPQNRAARRLAGPFGIEAETASALGARRRRRRSASAGRRHESCRSPAPSPRTG